MAHPLEATIRDAYGAFGRGDIDGYLKPCTDDFAFIIPGSGGISGSYVGKQGLYELAGKGMALTDGTFHEEVEEVLASEEHAIVLARHRFTRKIRRMPSPSNLASPMPIFATILVALSVGFFVGAKHPFGDAPAVNKTSYQQAIV